jgi:hypothetical protein
MRSRKLEREDKYEIVVKKIGRKDPVEKNILGEKETQEVLRVIGMLNLRSALAS